MSEEPEPKWIGFTSDWETDAEIDPSMFRCRRCGEVCFSTEECWDHRSGIFLTSCERARLLDKFANTIQQLVGKDESNQT